MREFLSQPQIYRANKNIFFNNANYKFNNYGFRCDDFDTYKNHKYRILFVGGSATEGIGLELQDCWPKILHGMICEELDYNCPYWNIAVAAASIDHISRYLFNVGDLLQPQIIISWLPPVERRERYNTDFWAPALSTNNGEIKTFIDERFINYQNEKNFSFINLMLERWNSIFLFRAFNKEEEQNFDFEYPRMYNIKGIPDIEIEGDIAFDGEHGGPKTNKLFAENMFKECWPLIKTIKRD